MIRPLQFIVTILFALHGLSAQNNTVQPLNEQLKAYTSVRDFTLSKNGNEAYFTIQDASENFAIMARIQKDSLGWSKPEIVPFSGRYRDIEPFLTPDQLRLYFSSNRPIDDNPMPKDYDIWYVKRDSITAKWSNPIRLDTIVNTKNNEFYPSLSANNSLYYTYDGPETAGKDDIFFSKWIDSTKTYTKPKPLPLTVNSKGYEFNAFISENEDYLVYTRYGMEDGFGSGDLYINFKTENDEWLPTKNLGETINSNKMEYCPFYDEATQTLYFTSKRNTIQQKDFKTIEAFLEEINQYKNGLSRLYKAQINLKSLKDD